jgi:hypothetical protein
LQNSSSFCSVLAMWPKTPMESTSLSPSNFMVAAGTLYWFKTAANLESNLSKPEAPTAAAEDVPPSVKAEVADPGAWKAIVIEEESGISNEAKQQIRAAIK